MTMIMMIKTTKILIFQRDPEATLFKALLFKGTITNSTIMLLQFQLKNKIISICFPPKSASIILRATQILVKNKEKQK